jgi:hypothetical protein
VAKDTKDAAKDAKPDTMAKRKAKTGDLIQSGDVLLQRNLMKRKATGCR